MRRAGLTIREVADKPGITAHTLRSYERIFIRAARALGRDCGPMGGFSRATVDAALFAASRDRG